MSTNTHLRCQQIHICICIQMPFILHHAFKAIYGYLFVYQSIFSHILQLNILNYISGNQIFSLSTIPSQHHVRVDNSPLQEQQGQLTPPRMRVFASSLLSHLALRRPVKQSCILHFFLSGTMYFFAIVVVVVIIITTIIIIPQRKSD